ncbi:unnamed protein product [Symbiodinium sp. KB8]|nr:unnamed protein product [Symbiodinium sp. KB8]
MASEVSLGSPQKISTGKQGRVELQPPSHTWISWCILLAYLAVFVEGVALLANDHYGPEILPRVSAAQFHLCSIYVLEVAIALGPGWCAMSPGWTSGELIAHHVPYTFTVMLCFALNQQHKWTLPLVVVLLTPLNEGLFIANSLGAPGWVAKARPSDVGSGSGTISLIFTLMCNSRAIYIYIYIHIYIYTYTYTYIIYYIYI